MKEKNLNISQSGQDQNQDIFSSQTHGNEESPEQDNNDHQGNSADEYDNYAPWG